MSDLKALHEAATPAPWGSTPAIYADGDKGIDIIPPDWPENGPDVAERCSVPDAAFIVALRNAYADGTLVERTPVGGERKPLEGYDWRGRLFALAEMAGNTGMSAGDSFPLKDELAAHIESLEADIARVKGRAK
jgi:hypothetical protein